MEVLYTVLYALAGEWRIMVQFSLGRRAKTTTKKVKWISAGDIDLN